MPCRAMYPYEGSLTKRLAGEPFDLLGFDVDADAKTLSVAMRAEGNTWRCWCENGNGPIASRWVSEGIPSLYLIDHEGIIRVRYVGFPGKDVLDHAIQILLKRRTGKDGGTLPVANGQKYNAKPSMAHRAGIVGLNLSSRISSTMVRTRVAMAMNHKILL